MAHRDPDASADRSIANLRLAENYFNRRRELLVDDFFFLIFLLEYFHTLVAEFVFSDVTRNALRFV